MKSDWIELEVSDGTTMRAFVARPDASGAPPGILVLQEAYGVNDHIRDVTGRFAKHGFLAIAPELFHRTAPGFEGKYDMDFAQIKPHFEALTPEAMIADMRAAHDWLAGEGDADPKRIAAVGYCMGGRAAYLANSALPLAASISYYGGGIAPALLDRAAQLHGPQLFYWGGKDRGIPPEQHRAVIDAVRAAGKKYVTVEFSEAQHGFFCDQRPQYDPEAARESWALTLSFLSPLLDRH